MLSINNIFTLRFYSSIGNINLQLNSNKCAKYVW